MADPRGNVTKIHYKVGGSFDVFLDHQTTPLIAKDVLVRQTIAAVLAVQEEVTLPLKGGKILRVERANAIPPRPSGSPPPPPGAGKITGIATQVDGHTGKSFFEVFFTVNKNEISTGQLTLPFRPFA